MSKTRVLLWLVTLGSAACVGAVLALWLTDVDPGRTPTTLITAAIALLVAGITALTTDRRQERQLRHEEWRQELQLEHDEQAISARFRHERVMEDLRELRAILDEARVAAMALVDQRYLELVVSTERGSPEASELALDWNKRYLSAVEQQGRLALRLGAEHVLTRALKRGLDAIFDTVKDIRQLAHDEAFDLVGARSKNGRAEFDGAMDDFAEKSRHRIGTAEEIIAE